MGLAEGHDKGANRPDRGCGPDIFLERACPSLCKKEVI